MLIVDEFAGVSVGINTQLNIVALSTAICPCDQYVIDTCIRFRLVYLILKRYEPNIFCCFSIFLKNFNFFFSLEM